LGKKCDKGEEKRVKCEGEKTKENEEFKVKRGKNKAGKGA
jgi:hypothetical protein